MLSAFDTTDLYQTHGSARMPASRLDLLQGTLDLLILRTLALSPMHGWAISQRIQQVSGDVLRVNQGSLYPALHRLEEAGWIDAEWGRAENNRQAKFYRLTKQGERQLKEEQRQWERMTLAVSRVLEGGA
jgi:PadR family transcriptional regulator PadR